jgi:hypothetical protein
MPTSPVVSSAPPRPPKPKPGEDALSAVLGATGPQMQGTELRIIKVLEQSEKPMALDELARKVTLGFLALSELLIDLCRKGIIVLSGPPGSELVTLARDAV